MMRIVDLEFSLRTIEKKVWLTLILLGFVSDNWIRYFHLEVLPSLETHYMKKKTITSYIQYSLWSHIQ
jgi:hypothetical protein